MVSMRKIFKGFSFLSAGVIHLFVVGVGLLIHVWAIVIAFSIKGLFAAAITLACPVLSEIFWAFHLWKTYGIFFNPYNIALLIYVGLGILTWILVLIYGKFSENDEEEYSTNYSFNQDSTKWKIKNISNKIIAIYGIVTYILSVIFYSTDLEGNLKFPIIIVLITGILSLIFVIVATKRLWNIERILSILFLSSYIFLIALSVLQEIIVPTYGSLLVIITNIAKVIRILFFIWVLIKLFKTDNGDIVVEP